MEDGMNRESMEQKPVKMSIEPMRKELKPEFVQALGDDVTLNIAVVPTKANQDAAESKPGTKSINCADHMSREYDTGNTAAELIIAANELAAKPDDKQTVSIKFIDDSLSKIDPANSPVYSKLDDISSARLFAGIFGRYIRYNTIAKSWYVFDGIKWKLDQGDLVVEGYAKLLALSMWRYSAEVQSVDFQRYVLRLQQRNKRKTMIEDARDLVPVSQSDFDADPLLFNCRNGVLNLKDYSFADHNPDLLLSKVANVEYNPDVQSEIFEEFMNQIMQGDQGKIEYLQTLFGYSMTGTNEQDAAYILYGSTTRNGKSTLTNTIRYLFGDYGGNIQPETLAMQKNRDGRTASGDIARLNGIRFLQMSEPPKRMKLDVALLKTLTGRDIITARNLYEREFEFLPCFKLFINTNYLPVVLDDSLFSSGRVKVITFDRHFGVAEQDHTLKDRLQTPESLSGILNWILYGLKRYHAGGIQDPDSVRAATDEYRLKSDKIRNFIDEALMEEPFSVITAKSVYVAYNKWCNSNGYGVENKSNFFEELRSKGLLSDTGTVDGKTMHNVVKGYMIADNLIISDDQ